MSSPRKDQAQGSKHTEEAPGYKHMEHALRSNPTEQAQGTHQIRQALGSSHPTEQVEGTHETGQALRATTPSYESVSDDMDHPEVRKARRELACDPDYNPQDDEVNYTYMSFMFISNVPIDNLLCVPFFMNRRCCLSSKRL
jgi:hypothetical protein